ncbi:MULTISPECIES: cyanophycin synthetase [unclassified Nitrosospira]|uniref:cyanophycin synthetase n=1 Tax=unclassified Nitrosospira TaxID=2609267 RepID=UPI000D2FC339|nr:MULTISPECIES: cyanophycin synthetase [unclassified Nitrosospira]PTR16919.1 cyanophycin synthetase [Nitrosospira sp. Nsp2]WON74696.1 cyanophycin synthetase [Nitrosospira sp. Is2]
MLASANTNTEHVDNKDIKFLEVRHLNGPNIWTLRPVLEAVVDIGDLEDFPSNTIPGFYDRLSSWLPSLIEHRCSYGERGGFLRRLEEGTWPGHILEHVTLELQNLAGMPGGFGRARETSQRGVYKVTVSAWHEDIARSALFAARELVLSAMGYRQGDHPFDVRNAVEHLRDMVDSLWLGPSTACIVEAALSRGIPSIRLLAKGNLVQLGYGVRSQRIWTAETDRTAAIAETISRDKDLTKELLRSCGVPVPEGRVANSAEDAWEAAQDIGLPVVIKPCDGNHGRGVFIELSKREEVESAYHVALKEGTGVLVERYVPGTEHRLLVVGGRLVAANRGDSVSVTGDGKATFRELIRNQINSDPRRGSTEDHPLNLISIDGVTRMEIARQGFTVDSIPPAGLEVLIQRNGNHAFDVTDEVHPSTAAAVSLAARVIGLDIAGIDLVARDISRPLAEQGGAIVEVNAGPSLLMHIKPAVGAPRPVGEAIVDHLFPNHEDGRIPVVGITGSHGKTTVAHIIAHLLALSGRHTGLACSDGFYLDRRQVFSGDHAKRKAANNMLTNRSVEAAVLENGGDSILCEGLAYDGCQIGVVTNVELERHYGRHDIQTPRQVFDVLRTQVDVVLPTGAAVLNARELLLVEMAGLCNGEVIYFSADPESPVISAHREHGTNGLGSVRGTRAVIVRDNEILLANGSNETPVAALAEIAFGNDVDARTEVENILAGVAAAWAFGIAPALIRQGIKDFYHARADARAIAETDKTGEQNPALELTC